MAQVVVWASRGVNEHAVDGVGRDPYPRRVGDSDGDHRLVGSGVEAPYLTAA